VVIGDEGAEPLGDATQLEAHGRASLPQSGIVPKTAWARNGQP
jgi:hypothetical protein